MNSGTLFNFIQKKKYYSLKYVGWKFCTTTNPPSHNWINFKCSLFWSRKTRVYSTCSCQKISFSCLNWSIFQIGWHIYFSRHKPMLLLPAETVKLIQEAYKASCHLMNSPVADWYTLEWYWLSSVYAKNMRGGKWKWYE